LAFYMNHPSVPLLRLRDIGRRFAATVALEGVNLEVREGEVVALMGANGAGKSTLVKIVAGVLAQDAGTVAIDGRICRFASPRAAQSAGIVTVHQATDLAGVPTLTVAENLVLDGLCSGSFGRFVSPGRLAARARAVADALGIELPLGAAFATLGPAERQLVAIARAVAVAARLVILDEPTASLSAAEAERLFAVIDRLRARGAGVLFISHRLGDLRRVADRAVVLRNGRVAGSFAAPLDLRQAVRAMIGRSLAAAPRDAARPLGPPVLWLQDAVLRAGAAPFNLTLHAGETVAVTGALGAGKSRLLRAVFGDARLVAGRMWLNGAEWAPRGPAQAIRAGVFMAAEDRWRSSLLPPATPGGSIAGSIALPHLPRWFPWGPLRAAVEHQRAADAIARLHIRCRGADDTLDQLSGGNQQKVVLARWQAEPATLLLLDEPFQGVDIGARQELVAAIRGRAEGVTLIATSDVEEALEVADRILVLRDGSLAGEHRPDSHDEAGLLAAIGAVEGEQAR
jgi:simple sugar transport system ATP-binding protein